MIVLSTLLFGKLPLYFHPVTNIWHVASSMHNTLICWHIHDPAKLRGEFDKRNTRVVAISVDTVANHKQWIKDINEIGNTEVNFPIIADTDRKVSVLYGMLDQTHLVQQTGQPVSHRSRSSIASSSLLFMKLDIVSYCNDNDWHDMTCFLFVIPVVYMFPRLPFPPTDDCT